MHDTITAETWPLALHYFASAQSASGLAETTIAQQVKRLGRLAQALGGSPWDLTTEQLQRWLDALPGSGTTVKGYRLTIRAFYRWALQTGNVSHSPAPAPPPFTRYTLDKRWQDAITLFETAQRADRKTPATIEARIKHVTRFASTAPSAPWQISFENVCDWLAEMECSEATRLAHRVSIRAFYRWAKNSGRIFDDPTVQPSQRAQSAPLPPLWDSELRAYRSYLRSIGRPESTVGVRMSQLSRLARENASLAPFDATLDDLIEWMSGKRWSAETRRGHRAALISFYRWAEDTGRSEMNPSTKLPIVKAAQPRPRPALEHEYAAALLKASDRETLALRLAAELGMRRAEVAVVHSRDITGESGIWSLVVHGKGDKRRTIPLPRGLASRLQSLPEGYAFPGQFDGHLSPGSLGKLISQLLPNGVTMHALRHRFATRAYNIDRDVFTVQQLLGHASPETTQRYVQVSDTSMRRLIDELAA